MYTTLISAPELHSLMTSKQALMVFDCSFELMNPTAGDAQYQQSHIVGAVRADLDRHLSATKGAAGAASALREYLHGDYLMLYTAMDATATVYLLSIRHHRQLSFDFARLWPGAGMPPSA